MREVIYRGRVTKGHHEPLVVLVFGSRTWTDKEAIRQQLRALLPIKRLIHGGAFGADTLAGQLAQELGISVTAYRIDPAAWRRFGRAAGPMRNQAMLDVEQPDLAMGFRCAGSSPGTDDMARRARQAGVHTRIIYADDAQAHAGVMRD